MIKIIFEVSEDFIRENSSPEAAAAITEDNALEVLANLLSFSSLEDLIGNGKTEFVVTPDKLDDKSKELYRDEIGWVCALAAFSENDNKKEKPDE